MCGSCFNQKIQLDPVIFTDQPSKYHLTRLYKPYMIMTLINSFGMDLQGLLFPGAGGRGTSCDRQVSLAHGDKG